MIKQKDQVVFFQNQTNRNKIHKDSAFVAMMNVTPNVTGP